MKMLFENIDAKPLTLIMLTKPESDALVDVLTGYLKTNPNKRSSAHKLAARIEGELLI